MAILSWGQCTIEYKKNGESEWTSIDTPKEDSTKLTPTAGKEVMATQEGGDIVDARVGKTTYLFEFDEFVKNGKVPAFEDVDGFIEGEYAIHVIPEDSSCDGISIERATLHAEHNYTAADGLTIHYVARCLKPQVASTENLGLKTIQLVPLDSLAV